MATADAVVMAVPPPGAHGGDGRLVAAALGIDPGEILDLSVNLNPFAPDLTAIVRGQLDAGVLGRYPDHLELDTATAELAGVLGTPADRVILTNGGAEAIALVAAGFGHGWSEAAEFSLYRRHLGVLDPAGAIFRSDPHNPSGRLAGPMEVAAVWDEAFYALSTGQWRAPGRSAAVVVGSLTKLFACPGLRVGYIVVPDDDGEALGVGGLWARLARRQPMWSVGPLALSVLPELLRCADVARWSQAVATARRDLVGVLHAHGFAPWHSDANFVLVPDASGLRHRLARHGVVVRDCSSFALPDHVRIAVPNEAGLIRLDRALGAPAHLGRNGITP